MALICTTAQSSAMAITSQPGWSGGALTGIGLGATAFLLGAAALTGWCYLRSRRVSPKEHNSDDRDVLFYGDDSLWRLSQKA